MRFTLGSGQGAQELEDPRNRVHDRYGDFRDLNHVVGDNYYMRRLVLLMVVFVEPSSNMIRIISARKAVD